MPMVAIKVLPSDVARDPDKIDRFQREAKVLASLNHPNIASIYGFEDSDKPGLVMELVEGPTLADRITAGPLPIEEALNIAKAVCEALEYAHEHGIVHRVMLNATDPAWVPDGHSLIYQDYASGEIWTCGVSGENPLLPACGLPISRQRRSRSFAAGPAGSPWMRRIRSSF